MKRYYIWDVIGNKFKFWIVECGELSWLNAGIEGGIKIENNERRKDSSCVGVNIETSKSNSSGCSNCSKGGERWEIGGK